MPQSRRAVELRVRLLRRLERLVAMLDASAVSRPAVSGPSGAGAGQKGGSPDGAPAVPAGAPSQHG
jgi:hypothetical protein